MTSPEETKKALRPKVVLVRHGQTEWSATGKHTGRTDVSLTELGRRQAKAVAALLDGEPFDLVLASPLIRAWETMELAGYTEDVEREDDLMEWDYGEYEGRRTDDVRKEIPGWSVWTHPIHAGESIEDVGQRADRVIDRLSGSKGALIFSHGHFLRILAARWLGLSPAMGSGLALDTATVSTLGWERENRVLRIWNQGCHLPSNDPPV